MTYRSTNTALLAAALAMVLAGCAGVPPDAPEEHAPIQPLDPVTCRIVDERLWTASLSARYKALVYAREALDGWLGKVRRRTESDFIPWYTSFGTQQWLSVKTGWYAMSQSEDGRTPAERLTTYLQREYYERVLEPVSEEINPRLITERAALRYLRDLRSRVREMGRRLHLPAEALDRRLGRITAISLTTTPAQKASLHDLIGDGDPATNPAFHALMSGVQPVEGRDGAGLRRHRFSPVTQESADELAQNLGVRGGATAAALAAGGLGGILISVAVSAWQAMEHEQDKPTMEAGLRDNLDKVMTRIRFELLHDPRNGIMAAANHIGGNVESGLLGSKAHSMPPRNGGSREATAEGVEPPAGRLPPQPTRSGP